MDMTGVVDFRCANCGRLLAKTDGNTEIKCPRCGAINKYDPVSDTIECSPKEADPSKHPNKAERSTSSGMTFR